MSYSNSFEGGVNTISRVFPAGTVGANGMLVGILPKDGKITRIRFHGNAAETGPLDARVFVYNLAGGGAMAVSVLADIDAAFTSPDLARAGIDAVLENQAARDAKSPQVVGVNISGTTVGEFLVVVQFEPR